jgi:predicted transcriptional regulator
VTLNQHIGGIPVVDDNEMLVDVISAHDIHRIVLNMDMFDKMCTSLVTVQEYLEWRELEGGEILRRLVS